MSDEEEVIVDESTSEDERKIRVYDPKGDFIIDVPAGAKVTFGYFNPASPREMHERQGMGGYGPGPQNVARQTALRIYERGEKGNQLACFIGVSGFRDHVIKLTRTRQRVVIERNLQDDGEGHVEFGGKDQRELVAVLEDDQFS
jgi:hypothetical protein